MTAFTPVSPPLRRSAMHWRVSRAWKSYTSSPPNATTSSSSASAPNGRSTAGIRHVTGSDDPARKGNPIFRAVSTISFANSHRQERCLSLKTGVVRPSFANTSTICLKNSYRGYWIWPMSLRGYFPCSPITSTASTASRSPPHRSASAIVG